MCLCDVILVDIRYTIYEFCNIPIYKIPCIRIFVMNGSNVTNLYIIALQHLSVCIHAGWPNGRTDRSADRAARVQFQLATACAQTRLTRYASQRLDCGGLREVVSFYRHPMPLRAEQPWNFSRIPASLNKCFCTCYSLLVLHSNTIQSFAVISYNHSLSLRLRVCIYGFCRTDSFTVSVAYLSSCVMCTRLVNLFQ